MASATAHFLCWEFFAAEGVLTLRLLLTFSDTDFFSPYRSVARTHTHTSLEKQANIFYFSAQKVPSLQVLGHDSRCSYYIPHEHPIRERNNKFSTEPHDISLPKTHNGTDPKVLSRQVCRTPHLLTVGPGNLNNFISLSCFWMTAAHSFVNKKYFKIATIPYFVYNTPKPIMISQIMNSKSHSRLPGPEAVVTPGGMIHAGTQSPNHITQSIGLLRLLHQ